MVNTESNVPSQDDLIDHEKVAKHKLRQKRSRWWLLLALVVVVVGYVAVMYVRNKDVYARVGDAVITKVEFQSAQSDYLKLTKNIDGQSTQKDIASYTLDQLALEKSLDSLAKKYNRPLTDETLEKTILDSNASIQKGKSASDTIDNALLNISMLYGVANTHDALRSYRITALKSLLGDKILQYRNIFSAITRWDFAGGDTGFTVEDGDRIAHDTLVQKVLPLMQEGKSDEEISDAADRLNDKTNKVRPDTIIVAKMDNLNKSNPKSANFQDKSEWDAIEQLSQIGDNTGVKRSEGGYYYIDRLVGKSEGKYASWDQYDVDVKKITTVYGNDFSWKFLFGTLLHQSKFTVASGVLCRPVAESFGQKVISFLTGADLVSAAGCPSSPSMAHLETFGGTIRNYAGVANVGVPVYVLPRDPSLGACGPGYGKFGPFKTDSNGYWETGRHNSYGTEPIRSNPSQPGGVSCLTSWKAQIDLGNGCFKEWNLVVREESIGYFNGKDVRDNINDIKFDCSVKTDGHVTISHYIKPVGASDYTLGVVPQANPSNNQQVDSCLASTTTNSFNCNLNEVASSAFDLPSGWDYSLSVTCGGAGIPPCLANGWVYDHTETYYPDAAPQPRLLPGTSPIIVGNNMRTEVRVYFRQVPPATVNLKINDSHGPIEIPSDSQVTATWYPNNANSCTTSNGAPGWASQSYGGENGSQDRSTDSNTEDATYTYTITCDGPGGSGSDSVTVRYRRQYLPWLQTKRGDVMVNDKITGQQTGKNGGRNTDNENTKEAEYVIISKVSQNFCSLNRFAFGISSSSDEDSCTNNLYAPKVSNGSDVINGLNKFASSNVSACNADPSQPYQVESNNLPSSGVINDQSACGKIWKVSGDQTLAGYTVNRGTATLWVHGNLTITGNITNNFSGSYTGYQTPGLGIIVEGDITIDPSVTRIDATLFATGKIKTCSAYPNQACRNQLTVNGMVGAQNGFELGRNYFEQTGPNRSSNVPAELFAGAAQNIVLPLPGFEDRISSTATGLQYLTGELNPRF